MDQSVELTQGQRKLFQGYLELAEEALNNGENGQYGNPWKAMEHLKDLLYGNSGDIHKDSEIYEKTKALAIEATEQEVGILLRNMVDYNPTSTGDAINRLKMSLERIKEGSSPYANFVRKELFGGGIEKVAEYSEKISTAMEILNGLSKEVSELENKYHAVPRMYEALFQ